MKKVSKSLIHTIFVFSPNIERGCFVMLFQSLPRLPGPPILKSGRSWIHSKSLDLLAARKSLERNLFQVSRETDIRGAQILHGLLVKDYRMDVTAIVDRGGFMVYLQSHTTNPELTNAFVISQVSNIFFN